MDTRRLFIGFVTFFSACFLAAPAFAQVADPAVVVPPSEAVVAPLGDTVPVVPPPAPVPAPLPDPLPIVVPPVIVEVKKTTLLEAVQKARQILVAELAVRKAAGTNHRILKQAPQSIDVLLALWTPESDDIRLVTGSKSGLTFTEKTPGSPEISITLNRGINSRFKTDDDSLVVGALIPAISEKKITKKKSQFDLVDTVTVPFSSEFYRPEVLAAGSDYLSFLIQGAFDELRERGIKSRTFPDKLLVDVIDPYLIKSIVVIEQCDGRIYSDDEPERAVGTLFVNLALNKDDAFDTAISSAGAHGLVQFIPSTYNLLVKNRPELALIKDFVTGMNDHRNAIKAEVALLDSDLAYMPQIVRDTYAADRSQGAAYMAAAYNGGGGRVRNAIAYFGESWDDPHYLEVTALQSRASALKSDIAYIKKLSKKATGKKLTTLKNQLAKAQSEQKKVLAKLPPLQKASLKKETYLYVEKLRRVYTMFTGGWFATPAAPAGALPTPAATVAVGNMVPVPLTSSTTQ